MSEAVRTCPLSLESVEDPVATPCCATVCSRAYLDEALRHAPTCPMCRTRIGGERIRLPEPSAPVHFRFEWFVVRCQKRGRTLVDVGVDRSVELPRTIIGGLADMNANEALCELFELRPPRKLVGLIGGRWHAMDSLTLRGVSEAVHRTGDDSVYVHQKRERRPRYRPPPPPPPSSPVRLLSPSVSYTARFTQADVNKLFNRKS